MQQGYPLGTVERLWRFPVKSLHPETLAHVAVDAGGFEGDRRSALFVRTAEHARSGKPYRGKEHNLFHTVASPAAAVALAAERAVELERRDDGPYFDLRPVSLLLDCWLAEAERLVGRPLDPLRYRPNIFARAAQGFGASEAALVGSTLQLGSVLLRVLEPIGRCVTTTYDVATGESDPLVLRAVAEHRQNTMGVYCDVVQPGAIAAGDAIVARAGA
jgi:uncharacterized protein YcbX